MSLLTAVADTLDAEAPSANYIDRCRAVLRASYDATLRGLNEMTEDSRPTCSATAISGVPPKTRSSTGQRNWGLAGA